jgi:hypothetical protein
MEATTLLARRTFRCHTRNLSRYDAVHHGFGETEMSGNDPYTVTLPMQLSNFLTIDNHSRSAKCFAFVLRS